MTGRLISALRRDVALQARYGLYWISLFVVMVWGVLTGLIAGGGWADAGKAVPPLLVFNLIITTFYFVAGLVLLEKAEGALAALVTTPQREEEYLLSKVLTLTSLGVAESLGVVVPLFGTGVRWAPLLMGAFLLGGLYVLLGFAVIVRYDSLHEGLLPSAVWVTLLTAPVLGHFGIASPRFFYLHPVQPSLTLMSGGYAPLSPGEAAYGAVGAAVWFGISFAAARRRFHRFVTRAAGT